MIKYIRCADQSTPLGKIFEQNGSFPVCKTKGHVSLNATSLLYVRKVAQVLKCKMDEDT